MEQGRCACTACNGTARTTLQGRGQGAAPRCRRARSLLQDAIVLLPRKKARRGGITPNIFANTPKRLPRRPWEPSEETPRSIPEDSGPLQRRRRR
eukprot:4412745-Pyramimonas_sp.AAC.1